jgi:hypothetical protein
MLFASCKDVYNPTVKNADLNYLVVEGNIVLGDSTFIRLSRTVAVSDTSIIQPERNATVSVEADDGTSFQLQNQFDGIYFSPPLNIDVAKTYRLHIFTADGKEYASEYVPVNLTPPIDSISWKLDPNKGVTIYANTHDATNNTQYYRWQFVETWEHGPKYLSELIYDETIEYVRKRKPEEQIYRCWNIVTSGQIILTSTTGLSADVVHEKPLVQIPYGSEKIDRVYSINVTQNALTKEAFEFWTNLSKNTEQLGSIFDPQPFADFGNIHCLTNAEEPVLGYISACSTTQTRIFIKWNDVQWPYSFPFCGDTVVVAQNIKEVFFRIRLFAGTYASFTTGRCAWCFFLSAPTAGCTEAVLLNHLICHNF